MNIRHEAVPVPGTDCPFDENEMALFENGMSLLLDSGDLPQDYGVTEAELRGKEFDEWEGIPIGLQKEPCLIQLSSQIWRARTEIWAQGLFILNSILASYWCLLHGYITGWSRHI